MKHITGSILILFLSLSVIIMSGCTSKNDDSENIPTTEELLASQYDEACSALGESCSTDKILEYVKEWADDKGLETLVNDNNILVISSDPSEGHSEDLSTTIHCTVTGKDNLSEMQYLSELMYVISNAKKHGKIYGIVSTQAGNRNIPEIYRDTDNFITLFSSDDNSVLNETAYSRSYKVSKDISWTSPRFKKAYKISISGLRGGNITDVSEGHPNPILQLNSIMAKWNTSGYLYDIASFSGGTGPGKYGNSASITVVISENDEEKFLSRIEKQQSSFNKKYGDDEENYEFTVEEVDIPDRVMTSDSANSCISLLYTMITGDYTPDDENEYEDTVAYSNIGRFSISDSSAVLKMQIYSMDKDIFDEMDDAVKTIGEISDFKVSVIANYPYWRESVNSRLFADLNRLTEAGLEPYSSFGVTVCTTVYKHNSNTECIGIGINFDNWADRSDMLTDYLKSTQK